MVELGRLPKDTDLELELELMTSPYFYRILVSGHDIDPDLADHLVRSFAARHGLDVLPASADDLR
ncbi:TetR/AcrR family transcriptional regulator C-terminal ligand-binding domain-containing protein [Amycolatopsis sp. BJA-103]|uniref:TetR/AcrR family transcriptional regulator C-terminal ligand-binding domain-containing protein n=1 Tax=Amycolatopsis sp. BJA-103 TaxID=1911175 RepID=UPI000C78A979|nr:TetR/AcrR family transcriptional regulator C-terminal ligand-binding domain-containing protein [Amycolatopsis sp. BJA-103]AUI58420.1 hypothetical protein BKN51_09465 [Amycolatopsis sp. BJA-103]PNE15098.1 hypothetical protein B1H26_31450 [Amycolatopsis sp. BJA-103]